MQHQQKSHFSRLNSTHTLPQGAALISENGAYYATLRDDGNLYIYVSNHFVNQNIVWSSKATQQGQGPYRLSMQDDGNLVVYDKHDKAVWSTDTWQKGQAPHHINIQSDGNLVLYDAQNQVTWASNTNRG